MLEAVAFLGTAALYMISMTITSGPNNVMLTSSGATFGFLRTLPHMPRILEGCLLLFAGISLELGLLFERYPLVQTILRVVGSGYLFYLALLFFFQAEDGIRDLYVTGVQTCALPISAITQAFIAAASSDLRPVSLLTCRTGD